MANANFFIVYINRLDSVSYESVQKKMDLARSWYRITERNWVLYTTGNADKWQTILEPLVKDTGSLFICKLDISEHQGWMDEKFWNWLGEKSKEE